jgi:hypothetical protein
MYHRMRMMRKSGLAIGESFQVNRLGLSLKHDDFLFVVLLAAWILLVAVVSYLLLGWIGAGAVITVATLCGMGLIAVQSRPRRPKSYLHGEGDGSAAH